MRKLKRRIIIGVVIFLLLLMCIGGGRVNNGSEKTSENVEKKKTDSSYHPSAEELEEMCLADEAAFNALQEVGSISAGNCYKEYNFSVYGKLYVNKEYLEQKGYDAYKGFISYPAGDLEQYKCYLYPRQYKVTTEELEAQYRLTWQEVYAMASVVYVQEQGNDAITAQNIRDLAKTLSPEMSFENEESVVPNLEWLAGQDKTVAYYDEHIAWAPETRKETVTDKVTRTSEALVELGKPGTEGMTDEDGDGYVTITVTEEVPIIKSYKVEREPDIATSAVSTWYKTVEYASAEGSMYENGSVTTKKNYGYLAKMQETYDMVLSDLGSMGLLVEDAAAYDDFVYRLDTLNEVLDNDAAYMIDVSLSQATTLAEIIWPLPGDYRTYSRFGPRTPPTKGASSFHQGWDIGSNMNAPIVAALAGTVEVAQYGDPGAGNYLVINHGDGIRTHYFHCNSLLVKAGEQVQQGQVIALAGSTGVSTGAHLHFGLSSNWKYIDPEPFLPDPKDAEAAYEGEIVGHANH